MAKIDLNMRLFDGETAPTMEATAVPAAAEGAQTGVPAANPARRGRKENPLANVQYGRQAGMDQAAADQMQSTGTQTEKIPFKQLIEGDYKEDMHAHVQGILRERFKKNAETDRHMEGIRPILLNLGQRYGVDMDVLSDESIKALADKVSQDKSHLTQRAMQLGISEDAVARLDDIEVREKMLRENERRTQQEQQARNHYIGLMRQAQELQQEVPGFDLERELEDKEFFRLTRPGGGLSVKDAYYLVHRDEIMRSGMQYAAQQGAQKVAQAVQSGQSRAVENGMQRKGTNAVYKQNPKDLNSKDLAEIRRRVRAGDTSISF